MGSRDDNKIRTSIGFSPKVLDRVDEEAEKEGRSRSNYVNRVLSIHLGLEEVEEIEEASKPLARSIR